MCLALDLPFLLPGHREVFHHGVSRPQTQLEVTSHSIPLWSCFYWVLYNFIYLSLLSVVGGGTRGATVYMWQAGKSGNCFVELALAFHLDMGSQDHSGLCSRLLTQCISCCDETL